VNRFVLWLSLLLVVAHSFSSHAHTGMTLSVPADGAGVTGSPATLELVFSGDVRLVRLRITSATKENVALEQSQALTPARRFVLPLPSLQPGVYTVNWVVMGSDSHKMNGNFTFTVREEGEPGV